MGEDSDSGVLLEETRDPGNNSNGGGGVQLYSKVLNENVSGDNSGDSSVNVSPVNSLTVANVTYANALEKNPLEKEIFGEDYEGKIEVHVQVECSNFSRSPEGQKKVVICIVARQLCEEKVTFEKIEFKGGKNASIFFEDRLIANNFILVKEHGPIKVVAGSKFQMKRIGIIHDFPCDIPVDDICSKSNCSVKILSADRVKEKKFRINEANQKVLEDIETETVKVTFEGKDLPGVIILYNYCNFEVSPYVSPVKFCSNCLSYGHVKKSCNKKEIFCANCGKSGHTKDSCEKATVCKNCGGNHLATDKNKCPEYKFNELVKKLMASDNLLFKDAYKKASLVLKKSVNSSNKKVVTKPLNIASKTEKQINNNSTSFSPNANVTKVSTETSATQMEVDNVSRKRKMTSRGQVDKDGFTLVASRRSNAKKYASSIPTSDDSLPSNSNTPHSGPEKLNLPESDDNDSNGTLSAEDEPLSSRSFKSCSSSKSKKSVQQVSRRVTRSSGIPLAVTSSSKSSST